MERPVFVGYAAVTSDEVPYIARNENHFCDWTSAEDKHRLRFDLQYTDAVVVGHTTYRVSQSVLLKHRCIVFVEREVATPHCNNAQVTCYAPGDDPVTFVQYCHNEGLGRVAVLGGSWVYTWFLEHDLLDILYITVEPVCFEEPGIPLVRNGITLDDVMDLKERYPLNDRGTYLERYEKYHARTPRS